MDEPPRGDAGREDWGHDRDRRRGSYKRDDYAAAGIPHYWIVDRRDRTLTVLVLDDGQTTYCEVAVVEPGKTWRTDRPFPIEVDPAELF